MAEKIKQDDQIYSIEKDKKNKEIVKLDGRSITSKTNRFKTGKYANLPIYCNDCYYRSEEAGGNGKCEAYQEDATCGVRDDIKKHIDGLDTRNPEDLRKIIGDNIKMLQERVCFSVFIAGMDGNLIDKATNAQQNTLFQAVRLMRELQGTTTITATEEVKSNEDADFIADLFRKRSVSIEKKDG